MKLSRDNCVDIFNLFVVFFNSSISIMKGNKMDMLSFVVIILLIDDKFEDI